MHCNIKHMYVPKRLILKHAYLGGLVQRGGDLIVLGDVA